MTPGPHRDLSSCLGYHFARPKKQTSERDLTPVDPRTHRGGRLAKMPNQSISEAECKRLAQVLEPKALPARSRSPQPPRTRRRDAAASRRGGSEHTPGLPKGRSRCGAGRRRPTKKKPNVTPRERPRLSKSFRSARSPRAAHNRIRPVGRHKHTLTAAAG